MYKSRALIHWSLHFCFLISEAMLKGYLWFVGDDVEALYESYLAVGIMVMEYGVISPHYVVGCQDITWRIQH